MGAKSTIEWTEATWNPVTGCTKISAGCKNCYAEKLAHRLKAMGQANYKNGFSVTLQPHMLDLPLKWRKPQAIFVNSMSDLFHELVPLDYIQRVFEVMNRAAHHRFQVLTKRADRLAEISSHLSWSRNIWMGVSVEDCEQTVRIPYLRKSGAAVKFLSIEPLLGPIPELELQDIDWVIVGGESGPKAREMCKEWVIDIRDRCRAMQVPFFFKQWGGVSKKQTGRTLDGKFYNEMPEG